MKKNEASSKMIADRMKKAAGKKTYGELGEILEGITSQAISSAIGRGSIPDRWFDIMLEKYGVTREELCRSPQNVSMSLEQNYGNAIQAEGCHTVNLTSGTQGQGGVTMQLTEREAKLIERLRIYGNLAVWAKIEADLDKIERAIE